MTYTASLIPPTNSPARVLVTLSAPTLVSSTQTDPADVFRAETVDSMFSYISNGNSLNFEFLVGEDNNFPEIVYKIRNNTISNNLRVSFSTSSFLEPISNITIPPEEIRIFSASFKKTDAISRSILPTRVFNSSLNWHIVPLNVTGPVFVKRNLPTLTFE